MVLFPLNETFWNQGSIEKKSALQSDKSENPVFATYTIETTEDFCTCHLSTVIWKQLWPQPFFSERWLRNSDVCTDQFLQ